MTNMQRSGWLRIVVLVVTCASLVGCGASGAAPMPRTAQAASPTTTQTAAATPEEAAVLRELLGR